MKLVYKTKYTYPEYQLKTEFIKGTFSENDWRLGETACVGRWFYQLPNESEYAIYKFAERTPTGNKKLRWEVYHNGKFSNNYFTGFYDAVNSIEDEIAFNGFDKDLTKYRIQGTFIED